MNKEKFIQELKKLEIVLTSQQLDQLERYYELLIEWNEVMNLTTITEKEEVYLKHFYDSATLVKIASFSEKQRLCDIGTGAGFPGVVLKIIFPTLSVTLVDSLGKRIQFLNEVINKLELTDIVAIHARAEDYAKNNREIFDYVTTRAVSKLNILLEYTTPLLKVGGHFLAMKGNCDEELSQCQNAKKLLRIRFEEKIAFELPEEKSHRTLISFKKSTLTDKRFPRRFEQIKKKPL